MSRSPVNSRPRPPPLWVGGVFALGLLLTLMLFLAFRVRDVREREVAATEVVQRQVQELKVTILRSMEVLYSIASLHQAHGRMERDEFTRFVQQAIARQPELQALSWNPCVPASRRQEFEDAAVADGVAGFSFREEASRGHLVPALQRSNYVPVYFIEPLSRNAKALGFDLNSNAVRRRSIEQARDSGEAIATAPVRLEQESHGDAGFLVLLPVYRGATPASVQERRDRLDGFAVAVFQVADLVAPAFRELSSKGIAVELFEQSLDGTKLFANAAAQGIASPLEHGTVAWLEVAGRRWAVAYRATNTFVVSHAGSQSWLILCGGLVVTLLTTAYLYGGWRRTQEIATANAALQQEVLERKRAEAEAAAANEAKSDFLASMSHEIRTPLNAILGYAQLMQRDLHLSGEQRDTITGIITSGQHLLGLINEILDLAKIEAGRMELNPVDFDLAVLGRGLGATFKPMCAQEGITFRVEFDQHLKKQVRGDEGKLRQVLINLLGNAVKFTNTGEVCLRFHPVCEHSWLFEVVDTGLGIPESEQIEIFKPFHQGQGAQHQGGTGLGLAIAKHQVELLGGKLQLQSERGIGSRFYFTIPLPPAAGETQSSERPILKLAPGSHVRALVLDDRKENREVLGGMLSIIGCEVRCAATAEEGLRIAHEQEPQVVFLDLLMPGPMAADTTRALLAGAPAGKLKVVMHTASPLARHREEALNSGCVDFLAKPFRAEHIYDCLKRHLGVEFEFGEPPGEIEVVAAGDLGKVILPEELCARLMVAAELHSTTALKAALLDLRQLGTEEYRLADQIRHLMRSYDMDGIQHLLARCAVPQARAAGVSQALDLCSDESHGP